MAMRRLEDSEGIILTLEGLITFCHYYFSAICQNHNEIRIGKHRRILSTTVTTATIMKMDYKRIFHLITTHFSSLLLFPLFYTDLCSSNFQTILQRGNNTLGLLFYFKRREHYYFFQRQHWSWTTFFFFFLKKAIPTCYN